MEVIQLFVREQNILVFWKSKYSNELLTSLIYLAITSDREVMFLVVLFCLFVCLCLSACLTLLAILLENL